MESSIDQSRKNQNEKNKKKKKKKKTKKEEGDESKKGSRRIRDLEWEERSSKVRGGSKETGSRNILQVDLYLWKESQ